MYSQYCKTQKRAHTSAKLLKKEFIINLCILIGVNAIIKPLYLFGVETEVQNVVGLQSWGVYFELFTFGYLFQIIHEPGLHSHNARSIARNPNRLNYHLPHMLGIKAILGCCFILAAMAGFYILGYDRTLIQLFLVIVFNQFLSTAYMFLRANISAIGRYRIDSLLSALDKLLMVLIIGFLVYYPPTRMQFEVIWLAYGQLAALVISCLTALLILFRYVGQVYIRISWKYFKDVLRQSFPYALILLFMSIYTRIDGVMLGRMLSDGNYEAGIYGACYRILDAMGMISYLVVSLLLPMFSSYREVSAELRSFFKSAADIMIVLSVIIGWTVVWFSGDMLSYLYDAYTPYFSEVMLPLVIGYVCISVSYLFGTFLVSRRDLKRVNMLYALGIFINISINAMLIPKHGAVGAAWATFVTEVLMLIGQIYLVHRYRVFDIGFGKLIQLAGFIGGVWAIGYLLSWFDGLWILRAITMGLTSLVLAFVLKILDRESFSLLRK